LHSKGIYNYAKHRQTSALIEAGNVSIGMSHKRALFIRNTEYSKLKIKQQSSLSDDQSIFYPAA
jgi:hypothetical protein